MAQKKTVKEALDAVQAKTNQNGNKVTNRYNKKNFDSLVLAIVNDPDYTNETVKKVKDAKGNVKTEKEVVPVTKNFRKGIKKIVEKAGVDKHESEKILTKEFQIDSVEGFNDVFQAALYEYMAAGNRYDLPSKEDFVGSMTIKDVDETITTKTTRNPKDGTILGDFKITKKAHKELTCKSGAPEWLTSKRKLK